MPWIKVTEQDIEKGIRKSHNKCPIARAAKRAFDCRTVSVSKTQLTLTRDRVARLPGIATQFIRNFDQWLSGSFAPFSFQIRTPKEVK